MKDMLSHPITKCNLTKRHCKYHSPEARCVVVDEAICNVGQCPDVSHVKITILEEEASLEYSTEKS